MIDTAGMIGLVSNCVIFGTVLWVAVVGGASFAGLAVWWDAVMRGSLSPARDRQRAVEPPLAAR